MTDADDENASILSDAELSNGGLVRATAWLREERVDHRAKKAAEYQRRFRERMRTERGLVPVNLLAPDGERPRSVLRGIARRMDEADYMIAAEVLVEDEDAYRLLSGSHRDLAIALTRTANVNLADDAGRAIRDSDLRRHLSGFAALEASARATLLEAVDDPILWGFVSRYRSDETFRAASRALQAHPRAVPVIASFDAETLPLVETLLEPASAPIREVIALCR